MLKLNKKHYKSLDLYPDTWDVSDATLNGDDFIRRVCSGLKDAVGHPDYSYQVGIAVPLNWKTDSGIMANVESGSVAELELLLENNIESKNTRLAAVLTGRNMREFVLYTSEPKMVEEKIKKLKENVRTHDVQYIIQSDPEWNTYKFIVGE